MEDKPDWRGKARGPGAILTRSESAGTFVIAGRRLSLKDQDLVREGSVFYQDAEEFALIGNEWKGYRYVGDFTSYGVSPASHASIMSKGVLQTLLRRLAIGAYMRHIEEQVERLKRTYGLP